MKKFLSTLLLFSTFNMYTPAMATEIIVKGGTNIPITFKSEYTSKNIEIGQKINAAIEEDVIINNAKIFKKDDNVILKVSNVKEAGFAGMAGEIELLDGEIVDSKGEKHAIELSQKITGKEKNWPKVLTATGICTVVLLPLALFGFVRGGEAKTSSNRTIDVSTKNDFVFTPENL